MTNNKRIIFAGTPEFAATCLESLLEAGFEIPLVLSQPDAKVGRGKKLQPPPVKQVALNAGIQVLQPVSLKQELQDSTSQVVAQLQAVNAHWMIVVAYGLLIPAKILSIPVAGCVNVHGSLLPRWRGAAPVQRAIQAGDATTGVCIMQMDAGLDTGPVVHQVETAIHSSDTTDTLMQRLGVIGANALVEALTHWGEAHYLPIAQDHNQANYAHKLHKDERKVAWENDAQVIEHSIRAFQPWPLVSGIYKGQDIKFLQAEVVKNSPVNHSSSHTNPVGSIMQVSQLGLDVVCGQNILRIQTIQLPGKKPVALHNFLNGNSQFFQVGEVFEV